MTALWYDYYPVLNWMTNTQPAYLQAPRVSLANRHAHDSSR
jgi:hypothetical protein